MVEKWKDRKLICLIEKENGRIENIIWKLKDQLKSTQDERLTTDRSMYVFWRLKVYTIALARTI